MPRNNTWAACTLPGQVGILLLSGGTPIAEPIVPTVKTRERAGFENHSGPRRRADHPGTNGAGFTSLVMGILGLATPWLPIRGIVGGATFWLPFLGIVFAPLALAFAAIGPARVKKGTANNKAIALTGLALGAVYLLLPACAIVFVLATNTHH